MRDIENVTTKRRYKLKMNLIINRPQVINGVISVKLDLSEYVISRIIEVRGCEFNNWIRFTWDPFTHMIVLHYRDVENADLEVVINYESKIKDALIARYYGMNILTDGMKEREQDEKYLNNNLVEYLKENGALSINNYNKIKEQEETKKLVDQELKYNGIKKSDYSIFRHRMR